MPKNLVIVESPAKSQTIKKFLWGDYEVKASFWHTVDLPTKELWIDVENNFEPKYLVSPDKKKIISELKSLASKAEKVWIATDEDREWEAIWRHIANQLKLDISKTARIVFHEITKPAIENAIKNPRTIDTKLVDAQQARRILDRLVWFELSPVLRQKIKTWLSAGRVQSVAVRVVVEREREIQWFESKSNFKVTAEFLTDKKQIIKAELSKKLKTEKEVQSFLESLVWAKYNVTSIETKPGKKSPSAPFTTSTLQQEASRKFGMPVARTMQLAQRLYEAWHITYMRTDSVNLSDIASKAAQDEIINLYGKEYSNPTKYATKSKSAQEAHECIRPTHFENRIAWDDAQQTKLYELIWKRTLASQMSPAELEKTKITIQSWPSKHEFIAQWEVIKFDWFLKLYLESKDDEDDESTEGLLPKVNEWENLWLNYLLATETFDKHPPRYTEASLVKKLEELWIWRPSTYAPTISTIQKRGYVVKEDRNWKPRDFKVFTLQDDKISEETKQQNTWVEKQKLFPTDIWFIVNDFLVLNFKDILDYNFTANVEQEFDEIAEWNLQRQKMIKTFYWPFHEQVSQIKEVKGRQNTERELWKDPKTWKTVIARMWKFWAMIQIGTKDETDETDKPKFASMPAGKNIETVTLEEALKACDLPRNIWQYEWNEVLINTWRFGPYIKYLSTFVSIPKEFDIFTITLDEAIPLIQNKLEANKNKNINAFDYDWWKIQVLNGRYWAYISFKWNNYRIPKWSKDATDLTMEDCIEIIWPKATSKSTATTAAKKKTTTKAKKSDSKTSTKSKSTKKKATK